MPKEMDDIKKVKNLKSWYNGLLVVAIGLVELLLLGLVVFITNDFMCMKDPPEGMIFKIVAIDLILIWTGILIGYFTWVIYFYNINLGLTHQDWAEIRMRKDRGEPVDEPKENPNHDNTLGIPAGTIRGSLALSLAVGALAMLIASLGISNRLPLNELFIDTFDFFKTAFLMMIAFYFGDKSLKHLNYNASTIKGGNQARGGGAPGGGGFSNTSFESEPIPELQPTPNPEAAAIRTTLNQGDDSPNDISTGPEATNTSDFNKPNADG